MAVAELDLALAREAGAGQIEPRKPLNAPFTPIPPLPSAVAAPHQEFCNSHVRLKNVTSLTLLSNIKSRFYTAHTDYYCFFNSLKAAAHMKLLEFVDYLLDPWKLASFYRELGLFPELVDAYGVAIYMVGSTIELDADIRLLSYRETQGRSPIQLDGIEYIYMADMDLVSDLLRDSEAGVVTKLDQANRIIDHALYDYRA